MSAAKNPYDFPVEEPYWKGHDRETDEKLAKELIFGILIPATISQPVGKKPRTRRPFVTRECLRHEYLKHDSEREKEARRAFCRLLMHSNPSPEILAAAVVMLSPDVATARQLVFQFRKRKPRHNRGLDLSIERYIAERGDKVEAAVADTMKAFGLTRKAVFDARRRARKGAV
jgi:hypothetical protein